MADSQGGEGDDPRPSFKGYWQRFKEKAAGKNLKFVPSKDAEDPDTASAQSKTQARRAQVRKAQIQHRQRKANYTKELEMDIARLRENIEKDEQEKLTLKADNDTIRQHLAHRSSSISLLGSTAFSLAPPTAVTAYSSAQQFPAYHVSLDISDFMNTPTFQVARSSMPSSHTGIGSGTLGTQAPEDLFAATVASSSSSVSLPTGGGGASMAPPMAGISSLSEAQTDQAINFILALEHICWDHFDASHYTHADYDATADENGHMLMASSIALQDAPTDVFERIDAVQQRLRATHVDGPPKITRRQNDGIHTTTTTTSDISWQTTSCALTLENLHDLASTLNPPDRELAPVQAWFEIARLYGLHVAVDAPLMDAVKRAFAGVVKCLDFGAVIERDAFESVLRRVIGLPARAVVGEDEDDGQAVAG
ncbi:Uu.00g044050.m01.CDS01 [Anthostomella pinea]|uniref:Uu.00g044050.m01.CDS01 n=1 Tax=Anthostomella pinea TaxID=933095 RepID=A0AAI8VBK5_9PEZI|nr:Uu.00g044050.m01.CDS01 [Anthostomella pinea]